MGNIVAVTGDGSNGKFLILKIFKMHQPLEKLTLDSLWE